MQLGPAVDVRPRFRAGRAALTYRHVPAPPEASVLVLLDDSGRELAWSLDAEPAGWTLRRELPRTPTARITMPAETLWRLATGDIGREEAARAARLEGERHQAEPVLGIVSVVR